MKKSFITHFHCAIPTWAKPNSTITSPSCFGTFDFGPIVAIWLEPWTWSCHLVNVLYLMYTFLVEFPHSTKVCSPHWSHSWSTKTRWSHNVTSLIRMPRHWLWSELPTNWWSLEFLGAHVKFEDKRLSPLIFTLRISPYSLIIFLASKMSTFAILKIHINWHGQDSLNHFSNLCSFHEIVLLTILENLLA